MSEDFPTCKYQNLVEHFKFLGTVFKRGCLNLVGFRNLYIIMIFKVRLQRVINEKIKINNFIVSFLLKNSHSYLPTFETDFYKLVSSFLLFSTILNIILRNSALFKGIPTRRITIEPHADLHTLWMPIIPIKHAESKPQVVKRYLATGFRLNPRLHNSTI